jgi:hypothetical protein
VADNLEVDGVVNFTAGIRLAPELGFGILFAAKAVNRRFAGEELLRVASIFPYSRENGNREMGLFPIAQG